VKVCEWVWGTYDDIIEFESVGFTFETFRAKSIASKESPIRTFNCLTQNDETFCRNACIGQSCDVDILIVTQFV